MARGFITLATGDIKYYVMALNMLKSFKIHNPDTPMAIICDKKNEVTAQFDDVVVLENANKNYKDKFSLLINSPYDESIFIEPDCLIYRNLDFFWDILSKESDFSCFGWNDGGISCWFVSEEESQRLINLLPSLKTIDDAPLFNPGYFFIRKSEKTQKMYNDCIAIADKLMSDNPSENYPKIMCKGNLRDDPIFNIAMALNGFVCNAKPSVGKCISLPSKYTIDKISPVDGKLNVTDSKGNKFTDCSLIHFSSRRVFEEGLYLWQKTLFDLAYKNSKLYHLLDNKIFYAFCSAYRYIKTRLRYIIKK